MPAWWIGERVGDGRAGYSNLTLSQNPASFTCRTVSPSYLVSHLNHEDYNPRKVRVNHDRGRYLAAMQKAHYVDRRRVAEFATLRDIASDIDLDD